MGGQRSLRSARAQVRLRPFRAFGRWMKRFQSGRSRVAIKRSAQASEQKYYSAAGTSVPPAVSLAFLAVDVLISARVPEPGAHTCVAAVIPITRIVLATVSTAVINAYAAGPNGDAL